MTILKKLSLFFAWDEIHKSKRLQAVFWTIWGLLIFDMNLISLSPAGNGEAPNCWEHIYNCTRVTFEAVLPDSYLYSAMTSGLLACLLFSGIFAVRKKWSWALVLLLVVFTWKFIWNMVLYDYATSNFDYFIFIPSLLFFFARNKICQLRLVWPLLYLFAALVKLNDGWILGTYFSSLKTGLPFLPDLSIPYITNGTILFEIFGALGLLARNRRVFYFSLWAWTAFHLYSGILVGYFYPVRCLSILWALFGFQDSQEEVPPSKKETLFNAVGVLVACYFCVANFIPRIISTNPSETFEGMNYGFHMFDANHQCLYQFRYFDESGRILKEMEFGTSHPMARCYPQFVLQKIKRLYCQKFAMGRAERVEWSLRHSTNGGAFYETISVTNACSLQFKAFSRNDWIKTKGNGALLVGYPEKNGIYPYQSGALPKVYSTLRFK